MQQRRFEKVMFKKMKFTSIEFRLVDLIFMCCIWVLAFLIRVKLLPIQSADYYGFLEKWMDEIRENGGFASLGKEISNYTSPYMYLMCLVSEITTNSLYGLKYVSIIFDYAASIALFLIVWQNTKNIKKSLFGMNMLLLSPAVVIDGAYWCQCDIIYTSLILYGLYYFFKDKSRKCLIFIGLAFSFKLQTLFILPFLIIMWLKNESVKFRHFVWIPIVYTVMQLPAVFCGRNFGDVMSIYFNQADYYPWGTLNYPNLYYFLDETIYSNHHMNEISEAGTILCIAILGLVAYYIYTKPVKINLETKLFILLFTVAVSVFTLPHMHDRYGFLIDIIVIIIVSINPKRFWLFAAYSLVSVLAFMPYLTGHAVIDLTYVAILNFGLLIYVGYQLLTLLRNAEPVENVKRESRN